MLIPIRTERLPWRELDGRAVIVQSSNGRVHELNRVATLLWKNMDGNRSMRDLAHAVADEFDVSVETATEDATGFCQSLESLGLIRWTGDGKGTLEPCQS